MLQHSGLSKDDAIDAEAAARSFLAGTATIAPKGGAHLVEMVPQGQQRLFFLERDQGYQSNQGNPGKGPGSFPGALGPFAT